MFEMTSTILRNLFSKQATRRYPRVKRPPFEAVRGELYNQIEACTFCTVCAVKCPSQCIVVDKKAAVWAYDPFACVFCGICVDDCPANCLRQKGDYRPPNSERQFITLKGQLKKRSKNNHDINATE